MYRATIGHSTPFDSKSTGSGGLVSCRVGLVLAVLVVFGTVGCGGAPAVEHHNLKLVSSLRTAVSARNVTWLDGVERAVESRYAEGRMSSQEREHFQAIIQLARRDWESADQACLEFEQSQLGRRRAGP